MLCYRDELCEEGRKPGQDRDCKPSTLWTDQSSEAPWAHSPGSSWATASDQYQVKCQALLPPLEQTVTHSINESQHGGLLNLVRGCQCLKGVCVCVATESFLGIWE